MESGPGVISSVGVSTDVGSDWVSTKKGGLWGRGEISMESMVAPGEEDGGGGVVAAS